MSRRVLVDAHVHLHDAVRPRLLLDSAAANIARAAGRLGLRRGTPGILCMADLPGQDTFERLGEGTRRWTIEPGDEPATRVARRDDGAALAIAAGRQLRTDDGLEVLALGTTARPESGGDLPTVLARVLATDAVVVLPWGFGKWWFARGRAIRAVLESGDPARAALGDNGGRPDWGASPVLARGDRRGWRVLSGTDPLPVGDDVERVGAFGTIVEHDGEDVPTSAATLLRSRLADRAWRPDGYGAPVGLAAFVRNQLALRRATASA